MPPERIPSSNRKIRELTREHKDNSNDDGQDSSYAYEDEFPRSSLLLTDEMDSTLEAGGKSEEYEKMYKRMKLLIRIEEQVGQASIRDGVR